MIFSSCQSDIIDNSDKSTEKSKEESVSFIDQGVSYFSKFKVVDNNIFWDNEEAGSLYQKLEDLPTLATLVHENGSIELFDSFNDMPITKEAYKTNDSTALKSTMAYGIYNYGISPVTLYLYADENKGGQVKTWNAIRAGQSSSYLIEIESLMPFDPPYKGVDRFNDVLSSFQLTCQSKPNAIYDLNVTIFQDEGFGGKSITFNQRSSSNILYISNLGNYIMDSGVIGIGKKTWNDRASSIKYWGAAL